MKSLKSCIASVRLLHLDDVHCDRIIEIWCRIASAADVHKDLGVSVVGCLPHVSIPVRVYG